MNKTNIPKLRFKEFSGEWENYKLGNKCKFTQGIQIPSNEQIKKIQKGYIRYLYIRDFFTNAFPCYIQDNYSHKVIEKNEIMIVNTGNTAGQAYMGSAGVLSNNCFKISFDKNEINNKFLFLFLTSDFTQRKIQSFFNSGGQPHLGHKNIALVPLSLPKLKEQQKIASFLITVDKKIEQLTKKVELQEQYKKGVMQKIFKQEIRFKNDDGSEFDEWKEKSLKDIATFLKGKGISKSDITKGANLECIRYGELYTIYNETIQIIKSKTNLKKDDLILSKYNDIVIPASGETQIDIATASCILKDDVALSGDLNIIRTKENGIFLAYYLNNFKKIDIARLSQGVSVIHLYSSQLKLLKINLPSLQEQTKIANFLSSLDKKIDSTKEQLAKTKEFKKGLLQRMFV